MILEKIRAIIASGEWRVIMPYGAFDFTPGANFFYVVIPEKHKGIQWHRDLMPALRRFIKTLPGFEKRPFMDRLDYCRHHVDGAICNLEGLERVDSLTMFDNRHAGQNDRLWVIYNLETRAFEKISWSVE